MSDDRPTTSGDYPRPNQPWICGLSDEGPPCPLGPTVGGRCPAQPLCQPVRDGDRWRCNRSPLRGGPCATGPTPDGQCAIVPQCMPLRSLRGRRGRMVVAAALAAVGALAMMLGGPSRRSWIAPGPLSHSHAQLVERETGTPRCAACHAAGEQTLAAWFAHTRGAKTLQPEQSMLCLDCHGRGLTEEVALAAHHGAHSRRDPTATYEVEPDRRRDPEAPLACAACHREHRGAEHDLTAITDAACQACHATRYDSFAADHPEFHAWPYERASTIAFDHAAHAGRHFPKKQRKFDCGACHEAADDGARQATRDYQATCAACHDEALAASWGRGVTWLALPTLDTELLADEGIDAGPWPEGASGDFDGPLATPLRLLLAADEQAAATLRELGPKFDFYDLDPDDPEQLAAAGTIAAAVRRLTLELSKQGPPAIAARLEVLLGRPVDAAQLARLTAGMSASRIQTLGAAWFGVEKSPGDSRGGAADEGLGWQRDDATLTLRYLPRGHDDLWQHAWLDALAEAASGGQREQFRPLIDKALEPTAPGQCGSCHQLRDDGAGGLSIGWNYLPARSGNAPALRNLTQFSHRPHLALAELADCQACHLLTAGAAGEVEQVASDAALAAAEFAPITRQQCATCHVPHAAGDSCSQCHSYHGGAMAATATSPSQAFGATREVAAASEISAPLNP